MIYIIPVSCIFSEHCFHIKDVKDPFVVLADVKNAWSYTFILPFFFSVCGAYFSTE
jgi:hypothetical protein